VKLVRNYTIFFVVLFSNASIFGQGRVVINEFMPWSGCSTTSEFIELLNFGPGPMNIGCYIVTNGTYSVTIPPNTIIQPRQYFILSGQNILSQNCGNRDSAVKVDVNWTTCNCTNVPIPTTGDGFMQNGGSANEKIVLLDLNLNVIDAVSRDIPVSSSISITTPGLSGGCTSRTFNLNSMSITYESINNSTGIDNSFARKVDGDCGWLKTTVISADAPNKTGSTSSATYDFSTLNASECGGTTGSISIQVSATDVNALFPMNYTLGFDVDGNETFNNSDQYTYGTDNTAPSIDISNLPYGRYRITVGSNSSCNLKSYDFYIFNCYGVVLPVKLHYFTYSGTQNDRHIFRFKVDEASTLNHVILEGSDVGSFQSVTTLFGPFSKNEISIAADVSSFTKYRLRLVNQSGVISYSQEIKLENKASVNQFWPNPVKEKIFTTVNAIEKGRLLFSILNSTGVVVKKAEMEVNKGVQILSFSTADIGNGIYYLHLTGTPLPQPVSFKFVK
jgi:hypothetical protein